jgi:hypothetical protein
MEIEDIKKAIKTSAGRDRMVEIELPLGSEGLSYILGRAKQVDFCGDHIVVQSDDCGGPMPTWEIKVIFKR